MLWQKIDMQKEFKGYIWVKTIQHWTNYLQIRTKQKQLLSKVFLKTTATVYISSSYMCRWILKISKQLLSCLVVAYNYF